MTASPWRRSTCCWGNIGSSNREVTTRGAASQRRGRLCRRDLTPSERSVAPPCVSVTCSCLLEDFGCWNSNTEYLFESTMWYRKKNLVIDDAGGRDTASCVMLTSPVVWRVCLFLFFVFLPTAAADPGSRLALHLFPLLHVCAVSVDLRNRLQVSSLA